MIQNIPEISPSLREWTEKVALDHRRVIDRIYAALMNIKLYADLDSLTKLDIRNSVSWSAKLWFSTLLSGSGPSAESLDAFREYGRRRVYQGLPLDALLRAFRLGSRELWCFYTDPDEKYADLRDGRTLSVDGMTTGFTFVLREILSRNSLTATEVAFDTVGGTGNRYRALIAGKHDATLVRTPFERLAGRHGLKTLVAVKDLLPDYLGTVGTVLQSWASANRPGLIGFLLAYREALNWIFDEQNALACCAMLLAQFADLTEIDTHAVYWDLVDPVHGLIHDMGIPDAGLAQVSRIRAAHAALPVNPAQPPCKDLQYLEEARASTRWAH